MTSSRPRRASPGRSVALSVLVVAMAAGAALTLASGPSFGLACVYAMTVGGPMALPADTGAGCGAGVCCGGDPEPQPSPTTSPQPTSSPTEPPPGTPGPTPSSSTAPSTASSPVSQNGIPGTGGGTTDDGDGSMNGDGDAGGEGSAAGGASSKDATARARAADLAGAGPAKTITEAAERVAELAAPFAIPLSLAVVALLLLGAAVRGPGRLSKLDEFGDGAVFRL